MAILLDTSVLLRLANPADAAHVVADRAVNELRRRGEVLSLTAQNFVELRAVATRPVAANGLGLDSAAAVALAARFRSNYQFLDETPAIYPAWQDIVETLGVLGKQVHDARLVAVCHVHNVRQVLTFNVQHFTRLAAHPPGVVVLDPKHV